MYNKIEIQFVIASDVRCGLWRSMSALTQQNHFNLVLTNWFERQWTFFNWKLCNNKFDKTKIFQINNVFVHRVRFKLILYIWESHPFYLSAQCVRWWRWRSNRNFAFCRKAIPNFKYEIKYLHKITKICMPSCYIPCYSVSVLRKRCIKYIFIYMYKYVYKSERASSSSCRPGCTILADTARVV